MSFCANSPSLAVYTPVIDASLENIRLLLMSQITVYHKALIEHEQSAYKNYIGEFRCYMEEVLYWRECGSILKTEENVCVQYICVCIHIPTNVYISKRRCITLSLVQQEYRGPPELIFTFSSAPSPSLLSLPSLAPSPYKNRWKCVTIEEGGLSSLLFFSLPPHSFFRLLPLRTQLMCLIWREEAGWGEKSEMKC